MPRSFGPIPLRPRAVAGGAPLLWFVAFGALVLRLYLASLWFRFGMAKIEAGWLTTNPARGLLTVVGAGQTPMPIPGLAAAAEWLLAVRADALLSVVLPLAEITLAAAFLSGCYVRLAAAGGIAVNASLILGGLASLSFDGRIILLQLLLIAAGSRAGLLGLPGILRFVRSERRALATYADGTTGPEPRRRAA